MAGIFAAWQPEYAARGVATFPVVGKRPAVKHYLQIGLHASAALVDRFGDFECLGLACRHNNLTILDVDTTDENVLADAFGKFGETPFVVRSGSGHFQAWYQNNGERRRIRPSPDQPIDILGDGMVVVPPSKGANGSYQIIAGTLDDLRSLPILGADRRAKNHQTNETGKRYRIERGRRNTELWRACMIEASARQAYEDVFHWAEKANQSMFLEPLAREEVERIASSAWRKKEAGQIWFGGKGHTSFAAEEIDELACRDPDAFILLAVLRRQNWGRPEFVIANAMADLVSMPRKRLAAARAKLVDAGKIAVVRPPTRHAPGIYRFVAG